MTMPWSHEWNAPSRLGSQRPAGSLQGAARRTARQRVAHDALDAAGTPAALRAAAQAGIHFAGSENRNACIHDGAADVVVGKHIAGADDHDRSTNGARKRWQFLES